jgi:hypothetical protein
MTTTTLKKESILEEQNALAIFTIYDNQMAMCKCASTCNFNAKKN